MTELGIRTFRYLDCRDGVEIVEHIDRGEKIMANLTSDLSYEGALPERDILRAGIKGFSSIRDILDSQHRDLCAQIAHILYKTLYATWEHNSYQGDPDTEAFSVQEGEPFGLWLERTLLSKRVDGYYSCAFSSDPLLFGVWLSATDIGGEHATIVVLNRHLEKHGVAIAIEPKPCTMLTSVYHL